jgi:hypothetical protein
VSWEDKGVALHGVCALLTPITAAGKTKRSYYYLTKTLGISAGRIMVGGDSAGGNIALALVRYILHSPPPLAVSSMSMSTEEEDGKDGNGADGGDVWDGGDVGYGRDGGKMRRYESTGGSLGSLEPPLAMLLLSPRADLTASHHGPESTAVTNRDSDM